MPGLTTTRRLVVSGLVAAVTLGLPSLTTAAHAASPSDQRITTKLNARDAASALGRDMTGLVIDAGSGRILYQRDRNERQMPASNTKIVTAVNSLRSFGASHRFTTRVVASPTRTRVVIIGSGDPSLSASDVDLLAYRTARAVKARGVRRVQVRVDDSLFPAPTLAYGWNSNYMPTDVSPVRALVVSKHTRWDTSIDAARYLAARLKARGVGVSSVARARKGSSATTVATVQGNTVGTIVSYMLRESDNDHAEAMHRLVARKNGYATSWSGARAAQRAVLAGAGVRLGTSSLYDGSGLSRSGRISADVLVRAVRLVFDGKHPRLASLRSGSFPVAGRTGTLAARYNRFTTSPSRCAAGKLSGKTGSLRGVISLSGFARGADGRVKLFSFLLNGVPSNLTTRQAVDRLAATITGCW